MEPRAHVAQAASGIGEEHDKVDPWVSIANGYGCREPWSDTAAHHTLLPEDDHQDKHVFLGG